MDFLNFVPLVRQLRERGLLFPVLVLVAVAAVLLQGALHREPPPPPEGAEEPAPPAPPQPSFRPELEKTPLTYEGDYWLQLAERASDNLVLIGPERAPGVLIAPGLALTAMETAETVARVERQRRAEAEQIALIAGDEASPPPVDPVAEEPREDEPAGPPTGPDLVGVDVEHRLALFTVPGSNAPGFMAADAATLRPGVFVAAVTLAPDGSVRITPGHLVSPAVGGRPGDDPFDVSITLPVSTTVAAIIDLDGDLIGLAVAGPGGVRVMSVRTALAAVGRMGTGQPCRAIEVADVDPAALALLGVPGGVLVERVMTAAFAGAPPIKMGDVLLSWNGQDVDDAEAFATRYVELEPGSEVAFRVLRGRRRVSGQLRMPQIDCRPADEPVVRFATLGLTVEWVESPDEPSRGWEVLAVREASPAAEAGVETADLIVAVDGRELVRETARDPFSRFERRPQPILLTIRRDAGMRLLAVAPPP